MAKVNPGKEYDAKANPDHSKISPNKLAPETYSNKPPYGIL